MTRDDIKQAVIRALIEIQTASGRAVGEITEATRPIGDLIGFDSLNAVEAVILISDFLKQAIDPNLILERSGGRLPQLGEIVDRICRQIGVQQRGTVI